MYYASLNRNVALLTAGVYISFITGWLASITLLFFSGLEKIIYLRPQNIFDNIKDRV